jgi:hypothetical protein
VASRVRPRSLYGGRVLRRHRLLDRRRRFHVWRPAADRGPAMRLRAGAVHDGVPGGCGGTDRPRRRAQRTAWAGAGTGIVGCRRVRPWPRPGRLSLGAARRQHGDSTAGGAAGESGRRVRRVALPGRPQCVARGGDDRHATSAAEGRRDRRHRPGGGLDLGRPPRRRRDADARRHAARSRPGAGQHPSGREMGSGNGRRDRAPLRPADPPGGRGRRRRRAVARIGDAVLLQRGAGACRSGALTGPRDRHAAAVRHR